MMQTLNEREQHVARVAADLAVSELHPQIRRSLDGLHKVVRAVAIISAIVLVGVTLGWIAVQRQTQAIQHSRFTVTRDGCRETNGRNRETILKLGQTSAGGPYGGQTSKDLERQLQASKLIINAILPTHPSTDPANPDPRNCDQYARDRIAIP